MAVCSSCGSEVSGQSKFCTACGRPMAAAEAAAAPAAPACASCGTPLQSNTRFCTGCGAPATAAATVVQPEPPVNQQATDLVPPEPEQPAASAQAATPSAQMDIAPAPASASVPQESRVVDTTTGYAAQPAPSYPTPSPCLHEKQPGSGGFRVIVLILLLVIVLGALGGWYFWGVETVVVVSPPDARVFLDGQELSTISPGRYVVPHLSRKPHLLRVQSRGFADTIQRLDFPLTSVNEWVNITLVRSRR